MDGSEILSLLESARKPTEFIGGVSSTTQSWVQVAVCSHPLVFVNVPVCFALRVCGRCVSVFCTQVALPSCTSEMS